jgi:ABC-type multidrug transport system fused ATPase/permease subunit
VRTAHLRSLEAFVEQDTVLFHDSIRKNLLIAKPDATEEELKSACAQASILDFIESLPKGFDTEVGELGDTLSGGERQRLGLARAFLHDAPFVLLDEPTSNLDALNEGAVLKALDAQRGKRTVLLISHRPSSLAIADEVILLDQGRVS